MHPQNTAHAQSLSQVIRELNATQVRMDVLEGAQIPDRLIVIDAKATSLVDKVRKLESLEDKMTELVVPIVDQLQKLGDLAGQTSERLIDLGVKTANEKLSSIIGFSPLEPLNSPPATRISRPVVRTWDLSSQRYLICCLPSNNPRRHFHRWGNRP